MTKDSITYYTSQCEVWLDISAGGLKVRLFGWAGEGEGEGEAVQGSCLAG